MKVVNQFAIRLLIAFATVSVGAQSYSAKVVDQQTKEPILFATVQTGLNQGVITNEEGIFTIDESKIKDATDSIYISSMGYSKVGISLSSKRDSIIMLVPKAFELKSVFLSNNPLSAKEIIEKVKENMQANYKVDLSKKKIFFRQSDFSNMDKVDFGFKRSSIEELNKELIDGIAQMVPKKSSYYREAVGDFYGDYKKHKLYLDKAAELYDKSKDLSVDGLTDRLERIFKENVKPDSYIKIRSGIFGTKIELDSVAKTDENEDAIKVENTDNQIFQEQIKNHISELYTQLFFNPDSKIDILSKSNRYKFISEDITVIDNALVYVLRFSPKGRKDFKGVMYVNTEDFAIVRLDFDNVRPISSFSLLGVTMRNNVYRGKMLFTKNPTGGYSPKYLELEDGNYMAVDRPLNVIEKNKNVKGRRKQNELVLALDIQMNQLIKYELVIFDSASISEAEFDGAKENKEIKATYLSRYDPNFWDGFAIMEPNATIQSFKADVE